MRIVVAVVACACLAGVVASQFRTTPAELIEAFDTKSWRESGDLISEAIGRGEAMVPSLIAALDHTKPGVRGSALRALAVIRARDPRSTEWMIKGLNDQVFHVRLSAAIASEVVRNPGLGLAKALLDRLDVESAPLMMRSCVDALAAMELRAGPRLIRTMSRLVRDHKRDLSTALVAARVLGKLGPAADRVLPVLKDLERSQGVGGTAHKSIKRDIDLIEHPR